MTNDRIRVEAHTALTPMRGRLYQQQRPDLILRYDLEYAVTADSPALTEKIIRLLDEAKGGMAGHGVSLALGNLILEAGVMGYVRKPVNGSGGRARFIPVMNWQGEPAWPDKYVKTDADAAAVNADIADPGKRKISLERKRRELNAGGRHVYEVEMLFDPVAAGSPFFDRATIERLIAQCTQPAVEKAGFYLWQEYNSAHRYAIWTDSRKGNSNEHSASVLIDFSTMLAGGSGSYANNLIPADSQRSSRNAGLFSSSPREE